ncbi:nucleotide exchange factor GrpE [Nodularia spumigena]|uniref:nucleotide exchange factor GrpE n=1 Tax=Nodularia spumigena TaxID=70799 RepID=UPI0023312E24|nr:nucleotide exchange factor GrpE [Nodularia spumigena]MDB9316969.1 nucleotide exchange factor GrpE [Nodularia spumigena CS-590/01A]MDB9321866.1 nucleotide exchange factor GrpE [Nodularia spumigena CS-591/07A]MDB9328049.1 nucleotide exchange factor GrpE [Nodularia spumigena CS-590/02]MDB9330081.1 nucleotide exchange factor GrpE [Nodularia spumigena CS-591/04]MDB9337295.1 nucleotide exchange factor GrpE [Nodularia spumigena CS-590/01]
MTNDKEALFAKLLNYLHSEELPPEYLGEPPSSANSFDPYQMVAEWTALRHEVKQQGKLLRSTQDALVQALAVTRADQEQLQISLEESQKQALNKFEQQQEKLLKDLLGIVDALDQACTYWQEELEALSATSNLQPATQKTFWEKLGDWINGNSTQSSMPEKLPISESLTEILTSNQQGVELIRRSLLEILKQRRVIPIVAQGKPFDSQTMYAVGRESRADVTDNTVIQEVVRGYLWGDKVLREAQVIVATQK